MSSRLMKSVFTGSAALALIACGGGGGSSPATVAPPPPPPVNNDPVYTPGVFAAASQFKDLCASPRAGTSDRAGSSLEEKFWIRSWTNETYLWYDEVTDRDPNSIAGVVDYFDTQKSEATTASGAPKDQFHFTINTEEYEARRDGEASAGYGARILLLQSAPPRRAVVAYTQPDSPAGQAGGLLRGDEIIEIDGEDLRFGNNVDVLNAGLFPENPGETHIFRVQGLDGTERDVTLISADVVEQPVTDTAIIDTDDGDKVGYIHFTTFSPFSSERAIYDAMVEMDQADVDDLVLDLRYNGGGLLAVAAQTGFMISDSATTNNRTFDRLTFSDKNPTTNPVTGQALRPTPFIGTGLDFSLPENTPLPELGLDRVFILTTDSTCSASEAVINGLRGIDIKVVLIGSTTCGKPYGFYPTDNCGETYFTIQFRGANDKGFGDYADGFEPEGVGSGFGVTTPGCPLPDDYQGALGDAQEPFLAAALQYREDGTCPAPATAAKAVRDQQLLQAMSRMTADPAQDLLNDPRIATQERLRNMMIVEANSK